MDKLFDVDAVKHVDISVEWYTPSSIVEAARRVLGTIDLDPASCAPANQTVKATRYFAKEDNGLEHVWYGSVWLNPPFGTIRTEYDGSVWQGRSVANIWIQKLIHEYNAHRVKQAILLIKADCKQNWFKPLWDYPLCFAWDRVYFNRPNNIKPEKMQFGTAFVYFGQNEAKFIEEFKKIGPVVKRVDVPDEPAKTLNLWDFAHYS